MVDQMLLLADETGRQSLSEKRLSPKQVFSAYHKGGRLAKKKMTLLRQSLQKETIGRLDKSFDQYRNGYRVIIQYEDD